MSVADSRLLSVAGGGERDEAFPTVNLIAISPDCSTFVTVVENDEHAEYARYYRINPNVTRESSATKICAWNTTTGRPLGINLHRAASTCSGIFTGQRPRAHCRCFTKQDFHMEVRRRLFQFAICGVSVQSGRLAMLFCSTLQRTLSLASSFGAVDENSLLIVDWVKGIRVGNSEASPTGSDDNSEQQQQQQLQLHTTCINNAVFSPDGSKLVTGAGSIRVWDTKPRSVTLKPLARMAIFATTYALAFSADGRLLASCDIYERVYVWDMSAVDSDLATLVPIIALFVTPESGYLPKTLSPFGFSIGTAVAFSRDGNRNRGYGDGMCNSKMQ